jgi:hypothetical protein
MPGAFLEAPQRGFDQSYRPTGTHEHISQPRGSTTHAGCEPRKQKTASCGRHNEPGGTTTENPIGAGGAGGAAGDDGDDDGDDEGDEEGTVALDSPFIAAGEGAPGAPGAVAVAGPPVEPGGGDVLAGWLSRTASAICAAPATAANPAATA